MREKLPDYGYCYADELADKLQAIVDELRNMPENTIIRGTANTYNMGSYMLCQIDPYVGFVNLESPNTLEYEEYFGCEDEDEE